MDRAVFLLDLLELAPQGFIGQAHAVTPYDQQHRRRATGNGNTGNHEN
ncbi:MAG TPA: hypothetical protein VFQ00_07150 [Terriglobales bacterium]|nr:hypothetical protein [Terriglobales bacterium]